MPGANSAHGVQFFGRLWLSGDFADATHTDSCFSTCSFFDCGLQRLARVALEFRASVATATTPDPRDTDPIVNNGIPDIAVPTISTAPTVRSSFGTSS